jgi:hypothetical protein
MNPSVSTRARAAPAACDAHKFKLGVLDIVRWWKRTTPGKRDIPKDLDLAILSRGRIRLPFDSVWWLVEKIANPADEDDWPARLPPEVDEILPQVEVTIELFIEQRRLPGEEFDYEDIFDSYLRYRHQHELPNCEFFLFDYRSALAKASLQSDLKLDKWGLSLDGLYEAAGVPAVAAPGNAERHTLLAYVSFPSELERYLLPTVEFAKVDTEEVEQLVWSVIGYDPDVFSSQRLIALAWRIRVAIGGARGGPGGLLSAILSGQKDIDAAIAALAGQAYALMDMATGTDRREYGLERLRKGMERDGFEKGYDGMARYLTSIEQGRPEAAYWLGRALGRLARIKPANRKQALFAIYEALYTVARRDSNDFYRLTIQAVMKRYCAFTYPHRSISCGPNP